MSIDIAVNSYKYRDPVPCIDTEPRSVLCIDTDPHVSIQAMNFGQFHFRWISKYKSRPFNEFH